MSCDHLLKELRLLSANPLLDFNLDLSPLIRLLCFLVGAILTLYATYDLHGLVPRIHYLNLHNVIEGSKLVWHSIGSMQGRSTTGHPQKTDTGMFPVEDA